MRIEKVEAIPAGRACYARVWADDGTHGVGESTFFAWPTAVAEIVSSLGSYLQGRDPMDTRAPLACRIQGVQLSRHGGDRCP